MKPLLHWFLIKLKMEIKLTIQHLENIIEKAKENRQKDSSLSTTIVIQLNEVTDRHTGNDLVKIYQKSDYSECDDKFIGH